MRAGSSHPVAARSRAIPTRHECPENRPSSPAAAAAWMRRAICSFLSWFLAPGVGPRPGAGGYYLLLIKGAKDTDVGGSATVSGGKASAERSTHPTRIRVSGAHRQVGELSTPFAVLRHDRK